jgi:hypothetical protein
MKKYLQYIKENKEVINLEYSYKDLTELPELPDELEKLFCSHNQ